MIWPLRSSSMPTVLQQRQETRELASLLPIVAGSRSLTRRTGVASCVASSGSIVVLVRSGLGTGGEGRVVAALGLGSCQFDHPKEGREVGNEPQRTGCARQLPYSWEWGK